MGLKDKVETIQALVTIAAVIVGGIWTYDLFVKERKRFAHANIEHKISHVRLSQQTNLLRVGVEITNTGSSQLLSRNSIIRIQQILPLPACPKQGSCAVEEVTSALKEIERKTDRFSWPLVAEREKQFKPPLDIEPSERDFIEFEFAVPSDIKVVRIYSYIRNDQKSGRKDEIGWSMSSHYDFGATKEGRAK